MASEEAAKDDGEWIDISPEKNGGLLKKILKAAPVDAGSPQNNDKVSVHYTGTLTENGDKFDSSRDRGDFFEFDLGKGRVIKGWDVGVATMKKGERAILRCSSDFGYGDRGSPPKIPGGASLDFDVELFSWEDGSWEGHFQKDLEGIKKKWVTEPDEDSRYDHAKFGAKIEFSYRGSTTADFQVTFVEKEGVQSVIGDDDTVDEIVLKLASYTPIGSKCIYQIPAKYAFGCEGVPEGAEPLFYEIATKDFEKTDGVSDLDDAQKLERGAVLKAKGNERYKQQKFGIAIAYYKESNDLVHDYAMQDMEDAQQEKAKALKASNYNNICMCNLKLKLFKEVIEFGEKALEQQPENAKALFRVGRGYYETKDYTRALESFEKTLEYDEKNKAAGAYVARIKAILAREEKKQNAVYKRAFKRMKLDNDKKAKAEAASKAAAAAAEDGVAEPPSKKAKIADDDGPKDKAEVFAKAAAKMQENANDEKTEEVGAAEQPAEQTQPAAV